MDTLLWNNVTYRYQAVAPSGHDDWARRARPASLRTGTFLTIRYCVRWFVWFGALLPYVNRMYPVHYLRRAYVEGYLWSRRGTCLVVVAAVSYSGGVGR